MLFKLLFGVLITFALALLRRLTPLLFDLLPGVLLAFALAPLVRLALLLFGLLFGVLVACALALRARPRVRLVMLRVRLRLTLLLKALRGFQPRGRLALLLQAFLPLGPGQGALLVTPQFALIGAARTKLGAMLRGGSARVAPQRAFIRPPRRGCAAPVLGAGVAHHMASGAAHVASSVETARGAPDRGARRVAGTPTEKSACASDRGVPRVAGTSTEKSA